MLCLGSGAFCILLVLIVELIPDDGVPWRLHERRPVVPQVAAPVIVEADL